MDEEFLVNAAAQITAKAVEQGVFNDYCPKRDTSLNSLMEYADKINKFYCLVLDNIKKQSVHNPTEHGDHSLSEK